jgi:copper chaperone CopZ
MTSPSIQVRTTHTLLRAEGFTCPSCVGKIEKQVGRLPGVSAVTVRFASARIEVDHDPAVTTVEDVIAAVARAGYQARAVAF